MIPRRLRGMVVIMALILAAATAPASAQTSSEPPRPGSVGTPDAPIGQKHVYDYADLLNPAQEAQLEADATRLMRFDLPLLIVVQLSDDDAATAAALAEDLRREWNIETSPGANDGMVLLVTVSPARGDISTTIATGAATLPNFGLDADRLSAIQTEWLDGYLASGHLYDGLLATVRRFVYYSIYFPAPIPEPSSIQRAVNVAVDLGAPLLTVAMAVMALRARRSRHMDRAIRTPLLLWGPPVLAGAVALLAIWSRSGWGATSSIALLALTALLWVWRDPAPRRHRSVIRMARTWMLIPAALFLLSLAINLLHVPTTEFHPDETRWLNRANYLTDLVDPFGPTWEDQYLTRGQPPLGSYLMGLGLVLQGRDTDTNGVWDFAYGEEWNRLSGAMASQDDLDAARRANAVVAATAVVLVFLIGRALAGPVAGTAGGLMLAIHPLHIWIGSQALSDQLLILLIALTLLTAIHLGRRPRRGPALALGVLLGLGGAAKLSPLLLSVPLALYGVALLVLARYGLVGTRKARRLAPLLAVQPLVAGITFVVSYPYLWPAPLARTVNLFELRAQEMDAQARAWPNVAIAHPGEAMLRIYDRLTWQFSATGNLAEATLRRAGLDTNIWGIDLVLGAAGIAVLVSLVLRRGLASGTALAAFLLGGQLGAIVVGMQVDFYRYHLPITLGVAILAGLAVQAAWDLVARRAAATTPERPALHAAGQPAQSRGQ